MQIIRSSKCNLKYCTQEKLDMIDKIRQEYIKVTNWFIDRFWSDPPSKMDLNSKILHLIKDETWFSQRMVQQCTREALDLIASAKAKAEKLLEKPVKPTYSGNQMTLSSAIVSFESTKNANTYDNWLHFQSIGDKIKFDVPIRRHKHFNQLFQEGKLCSTIRILKNHIMFSFKIDTGPKLAPDACVGVDTGIKVLASLSDGQQFGPDIEAKIQRIKRCKHGSKGQQRARVDLKSYISYIAKQVAKQGTLIVVENLKGISQNTKKSKRLSKSMRYVIGSWNQSYWIGRLEAACERNRVSFRRVAPYNTSVECSNCHHTDKRNRPTRDTFECQSCGHLADADLNASKVILHRFLSGPYGAGCKAKLEKLEIFISN